MSQTATTIYLDESQRKKLFRLAEERKTSFSSEIRSAIDQYVGQSELRVSTDEASMLVRQANESIDRMIKALDAAHDTVEQILQGNRKKKHK